MKELSISETNYLKVKSSSKRWIILFLSLIFGQIALLFFTYYKQKSKLKKLLSDITTLEAFVESQKSILETRAQLKKDYEFLINKKISLKGNTKLPKLVLKKISKNIPIDCCITNLTFKNDTISITGISKTWISLHNFFDNLSKINGLGTILLKNTKKESQYITFEIDFLKKITGVKV